MPKIIDKRIGGNWRVIIGNTECPFIFYPRSDIACKILEDRKEKGHWLNPDSSTYCCYADCPFKEV
jgi:hypothetical protein